MQHFSPVVASLMFVTLGACGGAISSSADELTAEARQKHQRTVSVRVENVTPFRFAKSGVFNTKVGGSAPGPIGPGEDFVFSFSAGKGQSLSFAVMLGESNDWFLAPDPTGIPLYGADGIPLQGDVSDQVSLWDVGSEINQEPGVGPDTGPHQTSPRQGAPDEDSRVRRLEGKVHLANGTDFRLPTTAEMIKVTLTANPVTRIFTVQIHNCSTAATLVTSAGTRPVHFSPGVFVTHGTADALFTAGVKDRGEGLAHLAESGNVAVLAKSVGDVTGVVTGFSPGVWKIHQTPGPFFYAGNPDRRMGLEHLAEDGNAKALGDSIKNGLMLANELTGTFSVPEGAVAPGPIHPGEAFTFDVQAIPGDRLSFASMFGASNDWFASAPEEGIALFLPNGVAVSGDVSADVSLWDVGTELNQEPGIGADTGPQQAAADTGALDNDPAVRLVTRSEYPVTLQQHLRVTLSPR